ncbi:Aste57867_25249 [Aphanomyces stellatus]|uniref:Aste57867_25249 protein n=1 Tax=Aphanomyces stellatus TaxID=120398 RepID=A0A485LTB2_9STRA|nr:hypothetical protein As57867_025171 [Aphanomyces stellatus]VFU01875.1 Aste57867_25249 [Aphanomyces stellatus]
MDAIDHDIVERLLFGDDFFVIDPFGDKHDAREDSTSDDTSVVPANDAAGKPKRKRVRHHRPTLKHEIMRLQEKQRELQAQLNALETQIVVEPSTPASVWEVRAKAQMEAAAKAKRDNAALRTLLQDQLRTAQTLERILKKKPKLEISPDFSADAWREWRLDADPARRLHAMTAITDHVYAKLDSEFIQHGLYDLEPGQSGITMRTQDNTLWFDFLHCGDLDVSYAEAQALMWAISCFDVALPGNSVVHTYGQKLLDDATTTMCYAQTKSTAVANGRTLHTEGRWLLRQFVEAGRTVIVCRSIVDDALHPHGVDQWRDNLVAWIVLEPCPTDATKTRQLFLFENTPTMPPYRRADGDHSDAIAHHELMDFVLVMMRARMEDFNRIMATEQGSASADKTL